MRSVRLDFKGFCWRDRNRQLSCTHLTSKRYGLRLLCDYRPWYWPLGLYQGAEYTPSISSLQSIFTGIGATGIRSVWSDFRSLQGSLLRVPLQKVWFASSLRLSTVILILLGPRIQLSKFINNNLKAIEFARDSDMVAGHTHWVVISICSSAELPPPPPTGNRTQGFRNKARETLPSLSERAGFRLVSQLNYFDGEWV